MAKAAPVWIIVAGPNGAGKTTIAQPGPGGILREFVQDGELLRLNADERARALESEGAPANADTNLRAARETDAALARAIREQRSVAVETVLSSPKYRPLVARAHRRGFLIVLVYVCLRSPALSARRVKARVRRGGHDVPADRIARRWRDSLENLEWFGLRTDAVYVIDNSKSSPTTLFSRTPLGVSAPGLDDPRLPDAIACRIRALLAAATAPKD